jgi:PAS domain S-box-containing protein
MRPDFSIPESHFERHAEALMRALPDGLCLVDGDGRILEVNSRLARMTGFAAEELVGQTPPYSFWPAEHRERIQEAFAASLDRPALHHELIFCRRGGERFPVEIASSALTGDTDGIAGFASVIRETTREQRERERLREAEERLRQAQRLADIGSFEVDYRTGCAQWSAELYRLLGVDPMDFVPGVDESRAVMADPDGPEIRRLADATLADGRPRDLVHRYYRGQELRHAELRIEPLTTADGERYGVRGTMQDVTARRRAEDEVRLQAQLLDAVDVTVVATDLDGIVTHWKGGAARALGWTADETIGRPVEALSTVGDGMSVPAILADIRATGQWETELELRRRDGSSFPAYLRAALFRDCDGGPAGIVAVAVDITERVAAERRLRASSDYQRAVTDNMGEGLFTLDTEGRLTYMNRAAEELLGWRAIELVGAVMHDAVHGHRADGTPYPVEECPLARTRIDGETARLADDLFIRRDGSGLPVEVTAAPFETEDGVRGSVVVFSDISERKERERELERQLERVSWVGRLRAALDQDRFVLHAQPIIDLATGETVQHELLLRLVDETGALVAPGQFLPTAEQYGLITEIDRWVVRAGIDYAAAGHPVELNLSAQSLCSTELLEDIRDALNETGADPALIVFELTETALMQDAETAERFIARLRELGCQVALDDFGTGYGGFTYLKRLPIDYLKIDMEFVRDLTESAASHEVVRAVVSLARGFGQRTVAEGVEDAATMDVLRELGVDCAQGYAIARPAPAADVLGSARA